MNTKTDSPSADETADLAGAAQAAVEQAASPDANTDAAGTSAADDKGATSPELSLEEVIRAANKTDRAAADTPADGKGDKTDPASDAATDEAKPADKQDAKEDAEEDKNVPFHKHPRWQELKQQRNELRDQLKASKEEIEPLRTKAEQLDQIGGFMRDNMLSPQEVQDGFEIMALMKQSPKDALDRLRRHVEVLELHLGERLPEDIRSRVDAGEVNSESAAELARQRAEAAAFRTKAEHLEAENRNIAVMALQRDIRSAVGAFENEVKTRDPDFSHKQPFLIDRMKLLASQNPPKTPEDAVAIAKRAYDEISEQMKKVVPARQQSTVVKSEHTTSTASTPTPKSLGDIVRQAIAH